ncbi:MAG: phytoene/squalene synthase family protein [Verrucomicrobia bacterium]|nr:phytoene/squalene synthase family protein [Verrucomicrobiota bacterium]
MSLPEGKRRDITTFYAFCRHVDDAADDPGVPLDQRRHWLRGWRRWLQCSEPDEPPFASEVRQLFKRYPIDRQLFEAILLGVEMDLEPVRVTNFAELARYCYHVAGAVGLVSIEIFGYKNPDCREYARKLGLALQLTNIIRDVDKDLQNGGRIYLPLNEMNIFGYRLEELERREYNLRFVQLMKYQADRARNFFREARRLLPREDRASMIAAEGMRAIYYELLRQMEQDDFNLFRKTYKIGRAKKSVIILKELASNWLLTHVS